MALCVWFAGGEGTNGLGYKSETTGELRNCTVLILCEIGQKLSWFFSSYIGPRQCSDATNYISTPKYYLCWWIKT